MSSGWSTNAYHRYEIQVSPWVRTQYSLPSVGESRKHLDFWSSLFAFTPFLSTPSSLPSFTPPFLPVILGHAASSSAFFTAAGGSATGASPAVALLLLFDVVVPALLNVVCCWHPGCVSMLPNSGMPFAASALHVVAIAAPFSAFRYFFAVQNLESQVIFDGSSVSDISQPAALLAAMSDATPTPKPRSASRPNFCVSLPTLVSTPKLLIRSAGVPQSLNSPALSGSLHVGGGLRTADACDATYPGSFCAGLRDA